MHCLEEYSRLDCNSRLRASCIPTQHRTQDHNRDLVRLTSFCRITRMYPTDIRDTVMMARKLVLF